MGGKLPWQGLKAKSKTQKYNRISKVKRETTIDSLCADCPRQFADYLKYCRKLDFNAKPDYKYLRGLFSSLFKKKGYVNDGRYDWVIKATKISARSDANYISSSSSKHHGGHKQQRYSNSNINQGYPQNVNRHSNHQQVPQQRGHSHSNVPPPPPNNVGYGHGGHGGHGGYGQDAQYVAYMNQQRQRQQQILAQQQLV